MTNPSHTKAVLDFTSQTQTALKTIISFTVFSHLWQMLNSDGLGGMIPESILQCAVESKSLVEQKRCVFESLFPQLKMWDQEGQRNIFAICFPAFRRCHVLWRLWLCNKDLSLWNHSFLSRIWNKLQNKLWGRVVYSQVQRVLLLNQNATICCVLFFGFVLCVYKYIYVYIYAAPFSLFL